MNQCFALRILFAELVEIRVISAFIQVQATSNIEGYFGRFRKQGLRNPLCLLCSPIL